MALYANITNLRWDYDETNAVKGCKSCSRRVFLGVGPNSFPVSCFLFPVSCLLFLVAVVANPAKNDVTPFNLNPAQSSEFYIANYLWDLIDC